MLRVLGSPKRLCDGFTRRDLLHVGGAAFGGLGLSQLLQSGASAGIRSRNGQGHWLSKSRHSKNSSVEEPGWQLKFVRRPLFQPSIPVVFDGDRKHYAVLEPDGTLNEHPAFTIREG